MKVVNHFGVLIVKVEIGENNCLLVLLEKEEADALHLNADTVRYADASELYVDFHESEKEATVTVANTGKVPEGEIVEGGGLSTLRRKVERAGGMMLVCSRPAFKLTVTVPKRKEGVL